MKKDERWWGSFGTAIYLCGWIVVVAVRHEEFFSLDLNELGDFLAGSFGPLAFAWLVLGYIQQGRELKLSSDALNLQAKELKYSVEQQSIMASAALKQIESQSLSFELQMQERERLMAALFSFEFVPDPEMNYPNMANLNMINSGGWADHVTLQFTPRIGAAERFYFPYFRPSQARSVTVEFAGVESGRKTGECRIEYVGLDKVERFAIFNYVTIPEKLWIFVKTPNERDESL